MKLSDLKCRTAKPEAKPYKLSDGGGLYLHVKPNGSKHWRMKYRFLGKEKLLSFGAYPIVTLSEARDMRIDAKKLLQQDVDPAEIKKQQKQGLLDNHSNTFKKVAREWHEIQTSRWSKKHTQSVMHRMEVDIFPLIGDTPIADIDTPTLLKVLRKVEDRGALDLASRVRQICGQVFRYAIQTGRCRYDPSKDLQGALRTKRTQHFHALQTHEIPEFLEALERNDARLYPRTRRAIRLSMLTFLRPGELRKGTWDEIDFVEKQWTIPRERMKMKRDHIVPLSRQALEVLYEQKEETGLLNTDYIFPSLVKPKKPISDGTVNVAIKKLGFAGRMTAHGFRAMARTAIREKLKYDPDVIECQLAHKAAGALGEAYNRAQFLDERKVMMQDWADYLDEVAR